MAADVAIVGAGVAGAAAAHALARADESLSVTVFEKRPFASGRTATMRRDGCVVDYGANYVKAKNQTVTRLIEERIDTDGLVEIEAPVWTYDECGTIEEGWDDEARKLTYRDGIDQLPARLIDAADVDVVWETWVNSLERTPDGWRLRAQRGEPLGEFDALLLTTPAPQTASLLEAANWQHEVKRTFRESIEVIPYRTIISTALHYTEPLDVPYYGLVNTDKNHEVGWVAREECKPGHVPDGESVLVVQMSRDWSIEHYEAKPIEATDAIAELTASLLGEQRLAQPNWSHYHRWRYALPGAAADGDLLKRGANHDLFFAGDWVAGKGRIHLAIQTGLDAAARVQTHL
jgi:hypothetical protein